MTITKIKGIGEPEPLGKKSLFQPPPDGENKMLLGEGSARSSAPPVPQKRIRTTVRLTSKALSILQSIQNKHRLETGEALPLWLALSRIIEKSEKSPDTSHRGPNIKTPPGASLAHT
jgi:hypothetical protein